MRRTCLLFFDSCSGAVAFGAARNNKLGVPIMEVGGKKSESHPLRVVALNTAEGWRRDLPGELRVRLSKDK